ncbi:Glycyl-glycine endopeptidase ALE-1 [Fundidesulfovibrio magnetotacticus]|uniref:Glycyl-glycine endopeptidase ALE-1 n=1 Tax=Fundidesulfovibrio magnetotacticus TaxID=2730080 RepID=A0A6V8LTF8_9BACT|nr:M23 family metallopeptidase [Fundidesulfovibrio magnetotacticus]GFK93608.1 Glycyl-glycine endopeptidase ALE-1 [Fundidesulfovibrio magnetotacticus]
MGTENQDLNGSGAWNLANAWKLGDLLGGVADQERQEQFAGNVVRFMDAGGSPSGEGAQGQGGALPDARPETAHGLLSFVKAGAAGGETAQQADATPPGAASGQKAAGEPAAGQGQEVRGRVSGEVRGSADPSVLNREDWERLKGLDYRTQEVLRQQKERENWERLKGLDPETQKMIHGPVLPVGGSSMVITSPYGNRTDPKRGFHHGIDIRNKLGDPVYASRPGTVVNVLPDSMGNNQIVVDHGDYKYGAYVHSKPSVSVNDKVNPGDVLGTTDISGTSKGPHLHFSLFTHNRRDASYDPRTLFENNQYTYK